MKDDTYWYRSITGLTPNKGPLLVASKIFSKHSQQFGMTRGALLIDEAHNSSFFIP